MHGYAPVDENNHGYGIVQFGSRKRGQRHTRIRVLAHRLAYEVFVGPVPAEMDILHSCDNPACFNPEHLRAGTAKENSKDMIDRLRGCQGERAPWAKLTDEKVRKIRSLPAPDSSTLAAQFRVSPTTIRHVLARRTWKHVS